MEELKSLADLLDLQEVDLQIDRLLNQRQSLPALDDYKTAHEELKRIGSAHDEAGTELRELNLELDKLNGELTISEEKLSAEQNRLYAGGLSARDADYLRQEVEMLGRRNTGMEDRILELMELRETKEAEVDQLSQLRDSQSVAKSELEATIAAEWKVIDAELARKEARKANIIPLVDEELLAMYEELRPLKEGVAVARLADGVCGGCHLTLTAAEQLTVSRGDPPRCIHCRRILVL